jgi:alpha-D-xyloside xylohydrolase
MMTQTTSLTVLHCPYGERHPYIPLACERLPHDPSTGEPVQLGIVTEPAWAAQKTWCEWRVAGQKELTHMDAQKSSVSQTGDIWQVILPAFRGGELIQYRLCAQAEEQRIESQEFSFTVSTWVDTTSVIAVEKTTTTCVLTLATTQPDLFIRLKVQPDEVGGIDLELTATDQNAITALLNPISQAIEINWGAINLSCSSDPLQIGFSRAKDGLCLQTAWPIQALVGADGKVLQYRLSWQSPDDEAFYGFGERFNALDQRGNCLDNRVYGQYTSQGKRSYIPIPFFLSSCRYGFWLKSDRQAHFDLAASAANAWSLTGEAEDEQAALQIKLFFQPNPLAIVQSFSKCTGKPVLPPTWVFGPWMSSNDWNSQTEVLRQLKLTREYGIPATVLVIEAWSDEINFYIWNDTQYELKPVSEAYTLKDYTFPAEGRWPHPKAMIEELHKAGVRLVLWQNPCIKQAREDEHLDVRLNQMDQAYAIEQGYVVKKADGSPHRVEGHMPWFGDSLVLDFTNPAAARWWCDKREYLVKEMGVDGFKTDGGEHVWDVNAVFSNGLKGSRGINRYPVEYEEVYRHFMEKQRGNDYVLFSRAGYTGAQQNPSHWAGDENSTWEAFRATINAMLNVGICGVPFMGWDIAGFAGPLPSSELYLRATAFSVFCPIMQYHSDVNFQRKPSRDRTPWNMQEQTGDESILPTFKRYANLRMNLLPYILNEAEKSSLSGLPMMRALVLAYPEDKTCRDYPWQYMFGDALLVAPVVEENVQTWKVYLPEGDWSNFWTGERLHGPITKEIETPRDFIPVYQRKSSMVALHTDGTGALGSPVGNRTDAFKTLTVRIFPGENFQEKLSLPGYAEPVTIEVNQNAKEGGIEIRLSSLNIGIDLTLFNKEPGSVKLDDQALPRISDGLSFGPQAAWRWQAERGEVILHLPEPCPMKTIKVQ